MKQLAITLVTTAMAATLNASTLPGSFLDSLDVGPKVDMAQTEHSRACADFSGSWKGTCTVGEHATKDESFTLKQKGCEVIEISANDGDKKTLPIGGVFSLGGSIPGAPAATFGATIESNWNKDQSALNLLISGGHKKLAIDAAPEGGMIKEEMKMDGGKLVIAFNIHHSKGKATGKCEFAKQ